MLGFVIGTLLGSTVAIVVIAMCTTAKKSDEKIEEIHNYESS